MNMDQNTMQTEGLAWANQACVKLWARKVDDIENFAIFKWRGKSWFVIRTYMRVSTPLFHLALDPFGLVISALPTFKYLTEIS